MEIANEAQLKGAVVEDEVVDLLLKRYNGFVMHGGTAVWRCYGGNRFSRDVDFYSNMTPSKESAFQKEMHKLLTDRGYPIREEKYNKETKTLHVIFRGNDTTGKLDITFESRDGVAVEYLRVDGAKRMVRALSPEALLKEKMRAYIEKYKTGAHEAQDLYDMIILKDKIGKPTKSMRDEMREFAESIRERPPKDGRALRQLLLGGVAPDFKEMLDILKRWLDADGE